MGVGDDVGGDANELQDTYSVGTLVSVLGIPRSTLLYYESLGIVRPHHDSASGYRSYTNEDVFRLIDCIMLRNIGIQPKAIDDYLDDEPFSDERLDEYIGMVDRRIAYCQAQRERLVALRSLVGHIGDIGVADIEPYYIWFDGTEVGYKGFHGNEALDLLLENLPVANLGAVFQDDFFDITLRARWGRTVPVRYAHLIPDLPEGTRTVGGCRCLCTVHHKDDLVNLSTPQSTSRWRIRDYLGCHGLKVVGNAFVPYLVHTGKGGSFPICLPVE